MSGLRRTDARYISGLPEPGSQENLDWLRESIAALLGKDGVDLSQLDEVLNAIRARLDALERGGGPVSLDGIYEQLAAIRRRLDALELGAPAAPIENVVIHLDPLDPKNWRDAEGAKAALRVLVMQEAARRCGHSVALYERMVELEAKQARCAATGEFFPQDEFYELMQQQEWAKERQSVELARLAHGKQIERIGSLEEAVQYDYRAGWPEV